MQLPGHAANAKRRGIRATETIGEGIVIYISGNNRRADVCTEVSVLCDGAGGAGAIRKYGGIVGIRDIDCDGNSIRAAVAIGDRNSNGVGSLRFIV